MNSKNILVFILLITFPVCLQGQYQKELAAIISSVEETSVKQQQLDSFFNFNKHYIPQIALADCYHDYGYKWYYKRWAKEYKQNLLDSSLLYTEKAAKIKRVLVDTDKVSLKKTLYNLGNMYSKKNDFFGAVSIFNELIEIKPIDSKTLSGYRALGNSYAKIGDFDKALNIIDYAIMITNNDTIYREKLIQNYLKRADIYSLKGRKEYSLQIQLDLQKVDSILEISQFEKAKYQKQIYQIEGNRLLKTKNYVEAIPYFIKVLNELYSKDSINKAIVYNSLGNSYLHLMDKNKAHFNLEKSISYNSKFTPAYENKGDIYIANQEYKAGMLEYQNAINYSISGSFKLQFDDTINKEALELTVNKYDLLHHLIQKANGWVKYYHFDNNQNHLLQALETFKMADQLVDIIRFESTEYKSKLFWREKGAALYMKAVETCYLLQKPKAAYYFLEKNKALLLLEDITNEQAKENAKLPDHIAQQEYEFKQRIYLSENELNISKNKSKDTIQQLKDKIYKEKRTYEKFVDSIAHAYPEYAENKKKIKVLPYSKFKANYISDQEIVLQYILNKNQGYGLLTTTNESVFFEIDDVEGLQENILTLGKQSSQWFKNKEQLTAYHTNANSIFKQILPQQVYELSIGKKLTVLPDYTLQNISFDALPTATKHHSYFIKDAEIRYAYSMSYLDSKSQIKYTPEYPFMGFAPVTFPKQELGDLTLSKEEVISISDLLKGNILIEENATTSNFRDTISQFKVIHLSTHADISDIENPWIAFSDKKLSLNEIYATKNQSDMVVLSACKTSLGEVKEGEGVMSLARGFFYSGAKSVVSSLWSANDKSNQELMVAFYKGLDEGLPKSTALRDAKLSYINTHQGSELSPFYWGSLILIGDNTPISFSQNLFGRYWIIGLFVIGCISIGIFNIRKKKGRFF